MKKVILLMILLALTIATAGCNGDNATTPVEQEPTPIGNATDTDIAAEETQLEERTYNLVRRTLQLETGEVSLTLPESWGVVSLDNDVFDFTVLTVQTYFLELLPPPDVKAMALIDIWKTADGQPVSPENFHNAATSVVSLSLPRAVEDTAEFIEMELPDGIAVYTILTDASLVGTTIPSDEYLYVIKFFANYDSGYATSISLFTDDLDSESFKIMLEAAASVEPSFEHASGEPGELNQREWERIRNAPVYDLEELKLLNHDLANSEYLTTYMLESEQVGETLNVIITSEGERFIPNNQEPDSYIWNSGGIGFLYYVIRDTGILENLNRNVIHDIYRLKNDGFDLSANLPLRMSADESAAVFGLKADIQEEHDVIYIYLLQEIEDSEYTILLMIMLFYHLWDDDSLEALQELSEQLGIDLTAYYQWW